MLKFQEVSKNCINYPEYVSKGYFIGSGAIESGNRSTMQERLKLPGKRWDITTAQYVLSAKMKYDSGLWDSYVVPLVYRKLGLWIKGVPTFYRYTRDFRPNTNLVIKNQCYFDNLMSRFLDKLGNHWQHLQKLNAFSFIITKQTKF